MHMDDLEKLHNRVLFMCLSENIPDYATYLTVDSEGIVEWYEGEPEVGIVHWLIDKRECGFIGQLPYPPTVDWRDCVWKI